MTRKSKTDDSKMVKTTIFTGFVGGFFWGSICLLIYYFNFLEITPKMYVLRSWITSNWTNTFVGDIASLLIVGILSIGISFIYYALFRKINSIWIGFFYGVILWMILFFFIQPFFPNIPNLNMLKKETIISSICLFILYGMFIGYSISYSYYEEKNAGK